MSGKFIFLIVFVCIDIAVLSAYLFVYLRRRDAGRPFPSAMWASYPLLIALLVLVPLVIVFENVMVMVILTALVITLYFLAIATRLHHRFAYPRGKRFRTYRRDYSFQDEDEEGKLPY